MTAVDAGRQWIVFPRWDGKDGFQHYRNRDPVWIKNYTRLTSSDEYRALSFSDRGLLHGLWLEYARSARALSGDPVALTRRLGQRVRSVQLKRLSDAGFLTLSASKPLAGRYHDASPEKEVEEERETPLPPSREGGSESQTTSRARGTNPRAKAAAALTCPHCRIPFKAKTLLDEHLYHMHGGPKPEHWADEPREPQPPAADADDFDLPSPEERMRIAAELRASLFAAKSADLSGNGAVPAEELPWEGDEPPVVAG